MTQGKRVAIVSDQTSSLSPEMSQEYGVHVVPTYVTFGTRTYRDGVDLDAGTFYSLLRSGPRLPTTSQPTAADFVPVYTELARQAEAIVSIHGSIKMTATADSARAAVKEMPGVPIHVIDSQTISMGLGMIVIAAARAAAAGQSAAQVVQLVEGLIPKVNVIFTVDTMEYLHKGGRIGTAAALLGSVLNIKPVLEVHNGRVEPLEKPRTRRRALERILDIMAERVGTAASVHAGVLHCDAADSAQELAERVQARFNCVEMVVAEAGPTIGTHSGPGTVGVIFYPE